MALSVKILEKGAGTKTRTATASLGGLITSESTGYTGTNCTVTQYSSASSSIYWQAVGTSGTSIAMNYVTTVSCATGKKVYIRARVATTTTGVDSITLRISGSTAGDGVAATKNNPTSGTYYILSGVVTMDGTYTGFVRPRWYLTDASGATGTTLLIYDWQAIDLTGQFGAGSEPSAADLDAFYTWRLQGNYANYGMYSPYGSGDGFYYASKIASHGLEYNDVVLLDGGFTTDWNWSNVFPLNSNWIITNIFYEYDRGDASVTAEYWTKVDYTSRLLAKSLSMNLRNDIEGQVNLAFIADSTWKPLIGMTVIVMNDTEYLFTGRITQTTITSMNNTKWRCDCVVSSMLETLKWNIYGLGDAELNGMTTMDAIDHLVLYHANFACNASNGGQAFWRGNIDIGNTSITVRDTHYKTLYEVIDSLCNSSGMNLSITPDRRLNARYSSATPTNAPRNITDAVSPVIFDVSYTEDISNYGNEILVMGGYDASGEPVYGGAATTAIIGNTIYAGNSAKHITVSDSSVSNATDANTAGSYYLRRHGMVMPGEFSFTTSATDYRPDQKITINYSSVGISSTKTANIDSVTLYDVDGINLRSRVVCSIRSSSSFAMAPNRGSGAYLTDISNKVSASVSSLSQSAGTFLPAIYGSSTAGTWAWTTQSGTYIRIGNMVYVSIKLVPSSISGSPAGNLTISPLPFTVAVAPLTQFLSVFPSGLNWGTSKTAISLHLASGGTTGVLYGLQNDAAWVAVPVGNVLATDDIRISGWYQCS